MGLSLARGRRRVGFVEEVRAGLWQKSAQFCLFTHPVRDLHGSRIGIIGAGTIGRSVGRLAAAFGMDVVYAGRKGERQCRDGYVPFDEVLATADVITLHCPLTEATRSLIAMPAFRAMQRRPELLKTARGGLVDERDVIEALAAGLPAGAAFDVAAPDPPPADPPLLAPPGRSASTPLPPRT